MKIETAYMILKGIVKKAMMITNVWADHTEQSATAKKNQMMLFGKWWTIL